MLYEGKYSLEKQLLSEGGSTKYGAGWKGEVIATVAFGGTLRPNHSSGNHTPSSVSKKSGGDIIVPSSLETNEVKALMRSSSNGTVGKNQCIVPMEITATIAAALDRDDPRSQLKRYAKRSGDFRSWRPAQIDPETGASLRDDQGRSIPVSNPDTDFVKIAKTMETYMEDEIFVVYPGSKVRNRIAKVYHFKAPYNIVKVLGFKPYQTYDRPAAEIVLNLEDAVMKTISLDDVNAALVGKVTPDPDNMHIL